MYYNYLEELDKEIKKDRKYANKKKIETAQMWREDSYGSASCVSTTMDRIFEAYHEYRTCECY